MNIKKITFRLGDSILSNSDINSLHKKMIYKLKEIYLQFKEF